MSLLHLGKGSVEPSKVEGQLRLYSMQYCPYAQRARLVLKVKNVAHDIVNINLIEKPEWYLKLNPEGKVPALDVGSKVIFESLDIANYLNDQYPEPALYPAEPHACQQDKDLINKIGTLTEVFYKIVLKLEEKAPEEWAKILHPRLEVFESELKLRGKTFFFGDKPGMVDYMLWPWAERAGTVKLVLNAKLLKPDDFPLLRKWAKEMRADSAVDSTFNGPEKFLKVLQIKTHNLPPEYDSI